MFWNILASYVYDMRGCPLIITFQLGLYFALLMFSDRNHNLSGAYAHIIIVVTPL